MKQTTKCMVAAFAVATSLALWTGAAPAADPAGSEVYVVRPGDTLAGIAKKALGDPKRWREILKANPQVTNANRIYPGDSLVLPIPATAAGAGPRELEGRPAEEPVKVTIAEDVAAATAAAEAAAAKPPAEPPVKEPELPVEVVRSIPVIPPGVYHAAGSISDALPSIAIVASVDGKDANGTGDAVVVSSNAGCGTRYTVVRADRRIFHPRTGEYLGWLIRRLGNAEISCSGQKASTAVLKDMRDYATVGDYLIPYDPNDVLEENLIGPKKAAQCLPGGPASGTIVAMDEDLTNRGEFDIVYIDLGAAAGARPGTRYFIYRELRPEGNIMVGEIQVLRAGERTSAALVINSMKEILVADLLRAE